MCRVYVNNRHMSSTQGVLILYNGVVNEMIRDIPYSANQTNQISWVDDVVC